MSTTCRVILLLSILAVFVAVACQKSAHSSSENGGDKSAESAESAEQRWPTNGIGVQRTDLAPAERLKLLIRSFNNAPRPMSRAADGPRSKPATVLTSDMVISRESDASPDGSAESSEDDKGSFDRSNRLLRRNPGLIDVDDFLSWAGPPQSATRNRNRNGQTSGEKDSSEQSDPDNPASNENSNGGGMSTASGGQGVGSASASASTASRNSETNFLFCPEPPGEVNGMKLECTPHPDSGTCVSYDKRIQAASLYEALTNFVDPSPGQPDTQPLFPDVCAEGGGISGSKNGQSSSGGFNRRRGSCGENRSCRDCVIAMMHKLDDEGLLKRDSALYNSFKFAYLGLLTAKERLGLVSNRGSRGQCPGVGGVGVHTVEEAYALGERATGNATNNVRALTESAYRCMRRSEANVKNLYKFYFGRRGRRITRTRQRRRSADNGFVGTTHRINCVPRGAKRDTSSTEVDLCGKCWALRVLPPEYFPRYVNELTCEDEIVTRQNVRHFQPRVCIGGFGQCKQRHSTIEVKVRQSNNDWVDKRLPYRVCCDCTVDASSGLRPLVDYDDSV